MNKYGVLLLLLSVFALMGCSRKEDRQTTPWGTVVGEEATAETDTASYSLDDIISSGEMIMLTISGPETYYDYHGHGMGLQYMLCEKFAMEIGVTLRVDLCTDTLEMIQKLRKGDADIIAFPLPKDMKDTKGLRFCGLADEKANVAWAVSADNPTLADSLDHWFRPALIAQVKQRESFIFSARSVTRHVYAPVMNQSGGVISKYDALFQRNAPVAGVDWRLLAAQCYQESCFDPKAVSWAGACGLMQILPSTGSRLGLTREQLFQPEASIEGGARYMRQLSQSFSDIANGEERLNFVLASYNGGSGHVRDAMALTRKYGGNPGRWGDVAHYMALLSDATYYRDPVVKHGYMRSTETIDYVASIRRRYDQYRGVVGGAGGYGIGSGSGSSIPQRATKKHKYKL